MRAAKKHAKVLIFPEMGKYFYEKTAIFDIKIKIAK